MINNSNIIQKKELIFAITTALSALFFFIFVFNPNIFQYGDNCGYMNLAIQFSKKFNFLDPALPNNTSLLWWPPGFPLYLSFFFTIFQYNWIIVKIFTLLMFFLSVFLFISTIYKNNKNIIEPVILISLISLSSTIHMISNYLYSELFFTSLLMIFTSILVKYNSSISFIKVIILSIFSIYLFSIRLIGISIPLAFSIYLYITQKNKNKFYLIPLFLLLIAILIFLFHPDLTVNSLRKTFGLSIPSTSYSSGIIKPEGFFLKIWIRIEGLINSLRGHIFTLFPQSLFRHFYSIYSMNILKMLVTGSISLFIILGVIHIKKTFSSIALIFITVTLFLLLYGAHYVRLLIPLVPFSLFILIQGIKYFFKLCNIKNQKIVYFTIYLLSALLLVDNIFLTTTNPNKDMPYNFGNRSYQQCIQWIINNVDNKDTVLSQINHYIHLKRKGVGYSIPFRFTDTPSSFFKYLKENSVDYLIISPYYQRPNSTYMENVKEIITSYPHFFNKVFSGDDNKSYILEFSDIIK